MRVHATSYNATTAQILKWQSELKGRYICVANVHMCMETYDDENFRKVVNNADMIVPDGRPLIWGLKALGEKKVSQVRGSDLLLKICKEAENQNIPIGLYGGTPDSLKDFMKYLRNEFPKLNIPFFISPPFRPLTKEEDKNYIDGIHASGVRILFVGIGCPKQENWMAAHRNKVTCVMIGVGAAFDFFSGRKKHAPRWSQQIGLEWLFRFISEPRRLWKRYLKHNPRFVWYFFKQWLNWKRIDEDSSNRKNHYE